MVLDRSQQRVHSTRHTRRDWALVVGLLFSTTITGCGRRFGWADETHDASGTAPAKSEFPLSLSATDIDFGIVPQGGQKSYFLEVRNDSDTVVELATIETSCDCLGLSVTRRSIEIGEAVLACVVLDLASEPDFIGPLAIELRGVAKDGTSAFLAITKADVRPASDVSQMLVVKSPPLSAVPSPVPMVSPTANGPVGLGKPAERLARPASSPDG